MAHQWFVLCDGEERGPLNGRQLKDLAANGQLTVSDLVRRNDMKAAVKAEAVKGLFVAASESCPPLPPAVNDGQGAIPEQVNSESSEKNSQGSSSTAQDPQKWFVLQNQMTYGPFDFAALRQMNAEGRIRPSDFIRKAESETWSPATSVLRFADQSVGQTTVSEQSQEEAVAGALQGARYAAMIMGGGIALLMSFAVPGSKLGMIITGAVLGLIIEFLTEPKTCPRGFVPKVNFQQLASGVFGIFIVLWCLGIFGDGTGALSAKKMRDFGDNPQNYKGKTLTLKLEYYGNGLDGWIENGKIATNLDIPFQGSGLIGDSRFSFLISIHIPRGFSSKVPPLASLDDALVTFKCTEGSLDEGNEAIRIVRP